MIKLTTARMGAFAAVAMAAVLAACSTPEPPPPPAPPPPPPPPAINLSSQLFEEASAWRIYMAKATAISPEFSDAAGVASSLRIGASYEPRQFIRGAISYAAVIALQDQTFVSNVRVYAADPVARQQLAAELLSNPNRVASLPGADRAAGLVVAALGGEGAKVLTNGRNIKMSAYGVQKQKWSRDFVPNRDGRLVDVRTLSTSAYRGDIEEVSRMQLASLGGGLPTGPEGLIGQEVAQPWTPVVVRGLALAALAALGEAGDDRIASLQPLLQDEPSYFCLNMSKLMLFQCLAAAKPHYEDVFCLGQHALIDTGQCTIKIAGAPMPIEPPPPVNMAASKPPAAKPAAKAAAKKK
ncbi:MAG: hypothetical protein ACK4RV_07605 [Caulobacter sp.]|jgi:hypothetical protein